MHSFWAGICFPSFLQGCFYSEHTLVVFHCSSPLRRTQTACTGLHGHGALQKGANANILFWNFLIMGRQRIRLHACWGLKGTSRCLAHTVCIQYVQVTALPLTITEGSKWFFYLFLPAFNLIFTIMPCFSLSLSQFVVVTVEFVVSHVCWSTDGGVYPTLGYRYVPLCYIKRKKKKHKQVNSLHSKFKQMRMSTALGVFL